MSEWKTYRLGDICSRIKSGKGIPASKVSPTGKYPVIGGNGIRGYTDTSNFKGDCAVVGRQGAYCGNVRFFTGEAYMTEHAVVIVGNELADTKYLAYLLSIMQLGHLSAQSAQPGLSVQTLSKLSIDIPDLSTQQQIAAILGALDDKIELNRRINANLEEQAQALFKSWFVDFEPFRDSPFVDSELGKIPQGWKEGDYTDIVEIRGGGTPKTDMQEYWNGNIPFFSPKDVGAGCFILDTEKHITAKGLENCNSSLFQPNTVFITARGTVGKVVMSGTEMAMNQTNYALLGKQNIPQYYVYHITLQLVGRLLKKANGAVFNAITTRDFACEQIVIPPYSTIKHFSDIVKPIYENILLNEIQSNRLSALRDTLLPKLMSGEISVEKGFTD